MTLRLGGGPAKKITTSLVFNFDDPDVGIEIHLPREVRRGFALGDDVCGEASYPSPLRGSAFEAGRSGTVEHQGTIEPIDAYIDRAGVLVAAARYNGGRALDLTAA